MFISVGNFINLGCHVKANCRPAVARLAGKLGYPEAACYKRKSKGGDAPRFSSSCKVEIKLYQFFIPSALEIPYRDHYRTQTFDKRVVSKDL